VGLCKLGHVGGEVGDLTGDDLSARLVEGLLPLGDLGLEELDLLVEVVGELAALVREDLEDLEAVLNGDGHLGDDLDHLLLDLLLVVIYVDGGCGFLGHDLMRCLLYLIMIAIFSID
jgi:hypothetical protein